MAGKFEGTRYQGDDTSETANGTAADETIIGAGGSDTLRGGGGDDEIYANTQSGYYFGEEKSVDKLFGDAGDDRIHAYAFAPLGSIADGGAGDDTIYLDGGSAPGFDLTKGIAFTLTKGGSYLTGGDQKLIFVKNFEELTYNGEAPLAKITGGSGDDDITSRGKGSELSGKGGDDYLSASLFAGSRVTIDGGAGDRDAAALGNYASDSPLTLIMSGSFAKGLTVKSGSAVVATLKGIESITINGGTGSDKLFGAGLSDSLNGGAGGNDSLRGLGGDDSISVTVGAGKSVVSGDAGSDVLNLSLAEGPAKSVVMSGTLGKLVVKYGTATSVVGSGFERVNVTAGTGDDKLFGGALNDRFTTGLGANSVKAGAGDDDVTAFLDAKLDKLDGGAGEDRLALSYPFGTDGAIVMKGTGNGTGFTATYGGKASMTATGFERLTLDFGTKFADTLVGLRGGDRLSGDEGDDKLDGGAGDDVLNGGDGNDTLRGGSGDDTLNAGNGVDKLDGGAGTDLAYVGGGSDDGSGLVLALNGGKTVTAKAAGKVVATLTGIEGVFGGRYDDTITGDKLDNRIGGGLGNNKLDGGAGNDTVDYGSVSTFGLGGGVSVTLKGAVATKVVLPAEFGVPGLPGSETATDTIRNFENVTGTAGSDTLTGDAKANALNGGSGGDDVLKGGAGNDRLIDGFGFEAAGKDTLEGGAGNDTYEVHSSAAAVKEGLKGGTDTVMAASDFTLAKGQEIEKLAGMESVFGFAAIFGYTLAGNEFANTIQGWDGADRLKGGGGKDTFLFASELDKAIFDDILDFNVKDDTIALSRSVFKALGKGGLDDDAFLAGAAAKNEKQHILYDAKTGFIAYDSDGSGKASEAFLFARVDAGLKLSADDFQIV